jgi:hypothetical protein
MIEPESISKVREMWMVEGNKEGGSVDTPTAGELCSDSRSRSEEITIEGGEEDDLEDFCRQAFYVRWVGRGSDVGGTRTFRGWGQVGWFRRIACH